MDDKQKAQESEAKELTNGIHKLIDEIKRTNDALEKTSVYCERLNKQNSKGEVIFRSFITGIAQLLGATIGITLLFFFLSKILSGIEDIPIVNIITKTELTKLIRDEAEKRN